MTSVPVGWSSKPSAGEGREAAPGPPFMRAGPAPRAIPAPQITTSAVGALITGGVRPARPLRQAGRPAGASALEFRKSTRGFAGECPHLESSEIPPRIGGFAQLFLAYDAVA